MGKEFLEIETKYDASDINRVAFKDLARSLGPVSFIYVESDDIYYTKEENEFLRYRMPSINKLNGDEECRSELTFKKKQKEANNWVRTEVNVRVDKNNPQTINAFCEGLGYKRSFMISKACDIYYYPDGTDIVFYSVKGEDGKYAFFLEIEAPEGNGLTQEQSWDLVLKYEKLLAPLGINPQKRKKLSLFEMYRK